MNPTAASTGRPKASPGARRCWPGRQRPRAEPHGSLRHLRPGRSRQRHRHLLPGHRPGQPAAHAPRRDAQRRLLASLPGGVRRALTGDHPRHPGPRQVRHPVRRAQLSRPCRRHRGLRRGPRSAQAADRRLQRRRPDRARARHPPSRAAAGAGPRRHPLPLRARLSRLAGRGRRRSPLAGGGHRTLRPRPPGLGGLAPSGPTARRPGSRCWNGSSRCGPARSPTAPRISPGSSRRRWCWSATATRSSRSRRRRNSIADCPRPELAVVPGADHGSFFSAKAELFQAPMLDFLRRHEAATPG